MPFEDVSKHFYKFVFLFVRLNDTVIVFSVGIIMENYLRDFLGLKLLKKLLGVWIHEIVKIFDHGNEFRVLFHVYFFELFRKSFNEKECSFRLFSEVENCMNHNSHDNWYNSKVSKPNNGIPKKILSFEILHKEEHSEESDERVVKNKITDHKIDQFRNVTKLLHSLVTVVPKNVGENEKQSERST